MSSQNRRNQEASWGRVIIQLGRGSSGVVELVEIDGRLFVVKKVLGESSQVIIKTSQLKILSQLQHPHIVRLKDWKRYRNQLSLLFQYDGEIDLQKLITRRAQTNSYFPESIIWIFLHQSLLALQYIHNLSIIHRDIKPSNLFIKSKNINLKIGDFGSAKKNNGQNYTRIGTPLYLSPQIISYESYTQKTDIWSLGVSIFHAAALKPPFQFKNFLKLAESISYTDPIFPEHISEKLKEIIQKMMSKDPNKRPKASQLINEYFDGKRLCQLNESVQLSLKDIVQNQEKKIPQDKQEDKQIKDILENPFRVSQPSHHQIRQSIWSMSNVENQQIHQLEENDEVDIIEAQLIDQVSEKTINLEVNFNDFPHFNGLYSPSRKVSNLQEAIFYNCHKSSLYHQEYNCHNSPFKPQKQNQTKQKSSHVRQGSQISFKSKHTKLMANLKQKNGNQNRKKPLSAIQSKPQFVIIDSKPLLSYLNDTFFSQT